ncbi:hypothetical protein NMY22_g12270 [Coprinellus aureogranulatus]|nr:hypothetical protein NMY22_g12270 [Coprinellus aureogranulatus]
MWPALQASESTSPQQEYLFNDLLPFELKSLIFTEYYRDTLSFKNPPIFSPSHPSVVLSHVCGEWRAIALSMHELWTDVNVPFPDRDDKSTPYPYERFPAEVYAARAEALEPKLTAWLQRSGTSSPLRVTLSNVDRLHLEGSDYMSDFLYNREHTERGIKVRLAAFDRLWSIISPTSTRWTDLDIPMSDRDGGWILGMLQASVDHSYVDLGSDWAHQILMLPNLTSLKLGADGNGEGFEYCFSWLAKQKWTELRSLELRESHTRELEQVLLLLRACPNLEDLVLERSLEHYQPVHQSQVF